MSVIAIIPARYDSTRFPGKPLAKIAGKPMILRVYQCAEACPDVSNVYVATDDDRIFNCVKDFGGKSIMTKKEHLSGTDRIAEAALKLDLKDDDIIVNIQGDQPTFKPDIISDLLSPFNEDMGISMCTLMHRISNENEIQNSNAVKVITDKYGFAIYFSRYPIPFYRDSGSSQIYFKHLGLYAYRMDFLLEFTSLPKSSLEEAEKLEQLRAIENGFKIRVKETSFNSLEVDCPEDIKKVEASLKFFSND